MRTIVVAMLAMLSLGRLAEAQLTGAAVRGSIEKGQEFLKRTQNSDGSWGGPEGVPRDGLSALVMLALLESGVPNDDPAIRRGLEYLRTVRPDNVRMSATYTLGLQTQVFCLARPREDLGLIQRNVRWLEAAQVRSGRTSGMWDYTAAALGGDFSNTQFALLGLREAAEIGVAVDQNVWQRARERFLDTQNPDGGWGYKGRDGATGSMTVAGIASLIITGLRIHEGMERLVAGRIENCGNWAENEPIANGLKWLAENFQINTNPHHGAWTFYYLYGLERACRLTGQRFVGSHDWYREGADWLLRIQNPIRGNWQGAGIESHDAIATSFALLFLAKGRAPVLINKLKHDSADPGKPHDWNNDRNDVRHLTEHISREWEHRMTWQIVDAKIARVEDLMQAPVLFLNGHLAPAFSDVEKQRLRDFVMNQGGFIFAEACCGRREFDAGFRALMRELFPEHKLAPLSPDHPIWKAQYVLTPDQPLEGIEIGCLTSVIYSPQDLSCYWEQKDDAASLRAIRLGTNVLAYATGREIPPDKLDARRLVKLAGALTPESRHTLRIGKLKHSGDWNAAPMAVPNLMVSIRDNLKRNVAIDHREVGPLDENMFRFPFLYMHGRNQFSYADDQVARIRTYVQHGGTLFADSCCGKEPFDGSFRKFAKQLFADKDLTRIPVEHELFTDRIGYDLRTVNYTKAMPRPQAEPFLEGIELDGRWAVIYSKWDIGCALERHQGSDCRGYTHESAVKIATNAILYALTQ